MTGCILLQVLELRDILRYDVETSVTERIGLEEFALQCLTYKLADGFSETDLDDKYRFYVTDDYKVLQTVPLSHALSFQRLSAANPGVCYAEASAA